MMREGLLREVEELLPFRTYNSMQTVGYREFLPYFDKKITLEEAIVQVKKNTRNYAKRQETWIRRLQKSPAISGNGEESVYRIVDSPDPADSN
jgi:tRNA A37 N6-isopentenylltransferase MiaA